jgi:APA family basic amino acid/polyamine antiporter
MTEQILTAKEAVQEDKSFKRSLGLLDATMIVAGSMIGSGIFIVSADMLKDLGSAGWLIAAWLITGFMTLTAAISYGELSAMFPKAGGQYVYLREAYNPFIGFFIWMEFFCSNSNRYYRRCCSSVWKISWLYTAFARRWKYSNDFSENFRISAAQLVAIVLIVLLTYINTRGIKSGKLIQTTFTTAKLLHYSA